MPLKVTTKIAAISVTLTLAGCGSDVIVPSDASIADTRINDGTLQDTSTDSGNALDASGDGTANDSGTGAAPVVLPLSASGHDRLFGVALDSAGNAYATGQMASSIAGSADYSIIVAKINSQGALDTSFGTAGIASVNVVVGRALELGRGIVVQSNGRIVVGGQVEHDPSAAGLLANDTDIVLVGFTATGALDSTFGQNGIVRYDPGTAVIVTMGGAPIDGGVGDGGAGDGGDAGVTQTLAGADTQWALELGPSDTLYMHGTTKSETRNDTDVLLARFTATGALDTTFSGDGEITLNIGDVNELPKHILVLDDGSVVASGYATSAVLGQTTQQPFLYKVTAAGAFDATFASADDTALPGVWYDFAVEAPLRAEAYTAILQGNNIVTLGYGTSPTGGPTDWLALRFSSAGVIDRSFGTNGVGYIDPGGMQADNARNAIVLPDQRILGIGGGRPTGATSTTPQDLMVGVMLANGSPDLSFAARGARLYNVGAADMLWDIATNGSRIVAVGIAGGVPAPTADGGVDAGSTPANADDDSVFFNITL